MPLYPLEVTKSMFSFTIMIQIIIENSKSQPICWDCDDLSSGNTIVLQLPNEHIISEINLGSFYSYLQVDTKVTEPHPSPLTPHRTLSHWLD